jgi:hypothetical protein
MVSSVLRVDVVLQEKPPATQQGRKHRYQRVTCSRMRLQQCDLPLCSWMTQQGSP